MRKSRFSEEQIIGILKEADAGAETGELCRRHRVSPATFYHWKARFGGLEVSDARRLRHLEESKIPTGVKPVELSVTKRIKVQFQPPLISFTLINDGPNSVYLDMNTEIPSGEIAPIKLNESFTFDAVYPVIKYLILAVAAGGTAAIRIRGKVGRHLAVARP